MTSKTGVHEQGNYLMHTGYDPRGHHRSPVHGRLGHALPRPHASKTLQTA